MAVTSTPGKPATTTRASAAVTLLFIEAEDGNIREPFTIRTAAAASGGSYVAQDGMNGVVNGNPNDPNIGLITFSFTLSRRGPTVIWARTRAATFDNNSFWVRVNDGAWIRYNDMPYGSNGFQWDDVHDADQDNARVTFDLGPGRHQLEFAFREPNAQLDRVLISQDLDFTP